MDITLVISYYKALANLKLLLRALNHQSCGGFEVIIAEDDNNEETTLYILKNKHLFKFPIVHLNQKEDKGFRKNTMLNKAIFASQTEMLVFIDGDCIPHKNFIQQYKMNAEDGYILWGRRVMLGQKISSKLLLMENNKLNFFSLILTDTTKIKDSIYSPHIRLSGKHRGIWGCNWGIKKQNLMAVNGFDEDYIKAGVGEDVDIEWRLLEKGFRKKTMKNKAIVFHLFHPRTYSDKDVQENFKLLAEKKKANNIKCINGLKFINP